MILRESIYTADADNASNFSVISNNRIDKIISGINDIKSQLSTVQAKNLAKVREITTVQG